MAGVGVDCFLPVRMLLFVSILSLTLLLVCEAELPNHFPPIIAALYQPPYNDIELENLCDTLNIINNPTTRLAGDLNLSNIDWLDNTISGNHYPSSLCSIL